MVFVLLGGLAQALQGPAGSPATYPRTRLKNALLIAYWFPPASNQTWRSFHLFEAIKPHFNQVMLLSTSNRKYLPEQDFKGTGSYIVTAPTLDYRTFTYFRKKEKTHVKEETKSRLAFRVYHLLNSFPFNLLIGEGGLIYVLTGTYKALALVQKHQQTLVFSTFRPYSDHAIGYLLKCFRPSIFWVADFRDLHLDPALNETFFPWLQRWFNRKILAKADVVTTVSKGLAEHLEAFHPNVVVLQNGIGNVVDDNAPRPSETERIKEALDKMLK